MGSSKEGGVDKARCRKRFLIVSLGSIGARHLRNLRALRPDAEIAVLRRPAVTVSVVDGADHIFHSMEEALAFEPLAAIVAGPASQHVSIARRLAEAGVHILIEKPLSVAPDDCRALIQLCKEQNLVLAVGYNLRFLPSLRALRNIVQSGQIGDVFSVRVEVGQYLPDWRKGVDYRQGVSARKELGGGALLELSHEIDYALWLFGMPSKVTAFGGHSGQLECDVEDMVEVVMEYNVPRRLVSVHLDMLQRRPFRHCRAVGTGGSVQWDGVADSVEVHTLQVDSPWQVPDVMLLDKNQMYQDELSNFFSSIDTGAPPVCTGDQGLDVLVVVEAARRSLVSGCAVELESGERP